MKTKIQVMNMKYHTPSILVSDIKIDRSSPLGNPFPLSMGRAECIDAYEDAIHKCLKQKVDVKGPLSTLVYREVKREMNRIYTLTRNGIAVRLFCWCAPLPCHGDVVKKIIEDVITLKEATGGKA